MQFVKEYSLEVSLTVDVHLYLQSTLPNPTDLHLFATIVVVKVYNLKEMMARYCNYHQDRMMRGPEKKYLCESFVAFILTVNCEHFREVLSTLHLQIVFCITDPVT